MAKVAVGAAGRERETARVGLADRARVALAELRERLAAAFEEETA